VGRVSRFVPGDEQANAEFAMPVIAERSEQNIRDGTGYMTDVFNSLDLEKDKVFSQVDD
jgi:hypothetical protein